MSMMINQLSQDTLSFSQQGKKWNLASDVNDVVNQIGACQSLKTLQLDGNTLGVEAAEAIGNALSNHPEFERALWKDLFTGRLKTEIPTALKFLFSGLIKAGAQLIELDLSDNALGPVGVVGMIEFMKSPVCYSLQELRLNNNGLGSKGAAMLARALLDLKANSEAAGRPLQLKVFIVGRNKMENDGAASFSEFFTAVGTLEVIEMPQNSIFHEGIAILAEAISTNKNLKTINLNDNTFTVKGAESMVKHLPKLENLETINFGDCLLRNDGAKKLALCLSEGHHKLQNLHLDGNEIKLSAALDIVDAIANKENFKFLGLEYNQIGEEMPQELSQRLKDIGKFNTLAFDDNEEPDSDEDESYSDDDDESSPESDIDLTHDYEFVRNEDVEQNVEEYDINGSVQTAANFLRMPRICILTKLGPSASVQLIHEIYGTATDVAEELDISYAEAVVSELITGVMKVSSVSCTEHSEIEICNDCNRNLWQAAFENAHKLGVQYLSNIILIHLGEVKSENKKFKIDWDISKCLQNLTWLTCLPCVPVEVKRSLRATLSLPDSKLHIYRNELPKLLLKLR